MKLAMWVVGAVSAVALSVAPAVAEMHEEGDKKFSLHGELRTRWDYTENYSDQDDDTDDSGSFFPYRARLAAAGQFSDNVSAYIEVQSFGTFGDRNSPLRFGADPTSPSSSSEWATRNEANTDMYQAYLDLKEIGESTWSLRMGRAEHTFANELLLGDADFYNGQSFDGIRGMMRGEKLDLDLFYYMVEEDDTLAPEGTEEDQTLAGVTLEFGIGENGQSIRPYLLQRHTEVPALANDTLYTLGAQWGRMIASDDEIGDNPFDWSLEAAIQSGDVGGTPDGSHGGSVIEGWFGYNWGHDDVRHRVHVGVFQASGDDDLVDDDNDQFQPLFGDFHANNRLGNLDHFALENTSVLGIDAGITDLNVGYAWMNDKHTFGASIHNLTLAEDANNGDEDGLGNELDLTYNYKYSANVAFQAGVANLFVDDAFGTTADDILRSWWQFQLRW